MRRLRTTNGWSTEVWLPQRRRPPALTVKRKMPRVVRKEAPKARAESPAEAAAEAETETEAEAATAAAAPTPTAPPGTKKAPPKTEDDTKFPPRTHTHTHTLRGGRDQKTIHSQLFFTFLLCFF